MGEFQFHIWFGSIGNIFESIVLGPHLCSPPLSLKTRILLADSVFKLIYTILCLTDRPLEIFFLWMCGNVVICSISHRLDICERHLSLLTSAKLLTLFQPTCPPRPPPPPPRGGFFLFLWFIKNKDG